jgi:hypothetical protein
MLSLADFVIYLGAPPANDTKWFQLLSSGYPSHISWGLICAGLPPSEMGKGKTLTRCLQVCCREVSISVKIH